MRFQISSITCGHPERKHYARGMCHTCYNRERYHANEGDRTARRKRNLASYYKRRALAEKRRQTWQKRARAREKRLKAMGRFERLADERSRIDLLNKIDIDRAKKANHSKPLTKFWWKDDFVPPRRWRTEAEEISNYNGGCTPLSQVQDGIEKLKALGLPAAMKRRILKEEGHL
jgi:hypothetical protein